MKADLLRAAAAILALLAPLSIVSAQEFQYADQTPEALPVSYVSGGDCCCPPSCCDTCCNSGCSNSCCNDLCCDSCCDECSDWAVVFDAEATFLRFGRSDGFATDDFDNFEPSMRLTLGIVSENGVGVRVRYWEFYENNGRNDANLVLVDTWNLDAELFYTVDLSCKSRLELSGGFRYNDWEDIRILTAGGNGASSFRSQLGGIVGLKGTHCVCTGGDVYVRANWAILLGDQFEGNNDFSVGKSQMEIGVGYEHSLCLDNGAVVTGRAGLEHQHWDGYDDASDGGVTFSGFVLGLGLQY